MPATVLSRIESRFHGQELQVISSEYTEIRPTAAAMLQLWEAGKLLFLTTTTMLQQA